MSAVKLVRKEGPLWKRVSVSEDESYIESFI